jgi:preprotein translocase subunit SecD
VITVPGTDGNQARNLGQTARLYIRPVIDVMQIPPESEQAPAATPQTPPAAIPGMPSPLPAEAPTETAPPVPTETAPPAQPAPQPRPYPEDPPSPTTPAPSTPAPAPSPTSAAPAPSTPGTPPDPRKDLADAINFQKALRQNPQLSQIALNVLLASRCEGADPLAGNDDPNQTLVTCSQDGTQIYFLDKSIISGDQIDNASAAFNQQPPQWVVNLKFKSDAANVWADYTAAHVGTQTAFVLDSQVVSAPVINEAIPGGNTQITGDFTAAKARDLANVLKYGSLPLSFESSEAETVSATLGLTSLKAGLIAGAIGRALVLIYALVYYRVLGLLTALSLLASGAMVFAILVLLGRYINYTLDLAGIAGLIIGIGTTADSFVVFFERIKDEIREGRSFRSAVPRGWVRARKTIVSGNAVTFLAAAVLYFLAIGQVKGFAFTLGLTTILDVVVVFLVTWPLMYLASKSTLLAKPAFNGLGAVQQIARVRRAAAHATTGQR